MKKNFYCMVIFVITCILFSGLCASAEGANVIHLEGEDTITANPTIDTTQFASPHNGKTLRIGGYGSAEWNFSVPLTGNYTIAVSYRHDNAGKLFTVSIDGASVASGTYEQGTHLNYVMYSGGIVKGSHTLKLTSNYGEAWFIDCIVITYIEPGEVATPNTIRVEAEECLGATGSLYKDINANNGYAWKAKASNTSNWIVNVLQSGIYNVKMKFVSSTASYAKILAGGNTLLDKNLAAQTGYTIDLGNVYLETGEQSLAMYCGANSEIIIDYIDVVLITPDVGIYDDNGVLLDGIRKGDITVKVNTAGYSDGITVIAAIYSEDEMALKYVDYVISDGSVKEFVFTDLAGDEKLNVFYWNNFQEITPVNKK